MLAAGLETAALGDRKTKIFIRINRRVVDAHLVMEVRPGGTATEADITDRIATMDVLTGRDGKAGKMAVARCDAVAVIDDDELSVSAHEIRKGDYAIRRSHDRVAVVAANIHPAVKRALTVERVDALAEAGRYLAIHWPKVGKRNSRETSRRW